MLTETAVWNTEIEHYQGADKSLARPTSRCILFDGENISFDASLIIYRVFHDFWGITAGGDFLGLCDEKSSYKHVSDFGRLRSYDSLKLRIEGNDYWQTEQNNRLA